MPGLEGVDEYNPEEMLLGSQDTISNNASERKPVNQTTTAKKRIRVSEVVPLIDTLWYCVPDDDPHRSCSLKESSYIGTTFLNVISSIAPNPSKAAARLNRLCSLSEVNQVAEESKRDP